MLRSNESTEEEEPMYNCIWGGFYKESEKAKQLISNRHIESLPRYRGAIRGWRMILSQRLLKKAQRRYEGRYGKHLDGDEEESYDEEAAEVVKDEHGIVHMTLPVSEHEPVELYYDSVENHQRETPR